ncbi:Leu/Ile/Val-binding protein [Burkholderiaceae bacterium]|nr:Leu/Ile/Val-binding protein [Burkholderiaceae bacterium]
MSLSISRRACLRGIGAFAATPFAARSALAASDDIVIGQSTHLSGPVASTMKGPMKGQELALEEFNSKGGVGGRKVRLITLDDAYDPKRCVDNAITLIERERVTALFGLGSTGTVAAVLPLLAEKKVPLVTAYTGTPALRTRQHPYFFTAMASYRDEVVQMVRNLVTVHCSRIALAYHDTPFGKLMLPVVEEVCTQEGATLVAKAALELAGGNSVAVCQTLSAARPQAVVFMAFGPALVPFVQAARAQIGVPVYAPSIANTKQQIEALGDHARGLAFTQIVPYPMRATTPITKDYAAAMGRAGLPMDFDHFFGYLNMRVMLETLRRAGSAVTPQSLVSTIEAMGRVDLGGYRVSFGPDNHHGSKFVDLLIIGPGGRFIR